MPWDQFSGLQSRYFAIILLDFGLDDFFLSLATLQLPEQHPGTDQPFLDQCECPLADHDPAIGPGQDKQECIA